MMNTHYFNFRPYWRCYYSNTDAIIYVVDSADKERIGISKDELFHMLRVSSVLSYAFLYGGTLTMLVVYILACKKAVL